MPCNGSHSLCKEREEENKSDLWKRRHEISSTSETAFQIQILRLPSSLSSFFLVRDDGFGILVMRREYTLMRAEQCVSISIAGHWIPFLKGFIKSFENVAPLSAAQQPEFWLMLLKCFSLYCFIFCFLARLFHTAAQCCYFMPRWCPVLSNPYIPYTNECHIRSDWGLNSTIHFFSHCYYSVQLLHPPALSQAQY